MYTKVGIQFVVPQHIGAALKAAGVPDGKHDEAAIAARYANQPGGKALFVPKGEKLALQEMYTDTVRAGHALSNYSIYPKDASGKESVFQLWFVPSDTGEPKVEFPDTVALIMMEELAKRRPVHVYLNPNGDAVINAPCPGKVKMQNRQLRLATDCAFAVQELDGNWSTPEELLRKHLEESEVKLQDEIADRQLSPI